MTFSEQLISLRKQRGLSQEQLGSEVGVTRQTVSKWELGETTPEMDKLIQLSHYFDISIDRLVGQEHLDGTDLNYMNRTNLYLYRWHYEYKSKKMFRGIPLVHINVGHGLYKAKGIIAVGSIAKGFISIGAISAGLLSLGAVSMGVVSLGAVSVGLLLSIGGISVGTIAIGGFAIGVLAIGGSAMGIYALGGLAAASKIAVGGYAHAPVAIGDKVYGDIVFNIKEPIAPGAIKYAILERFPHTWEIIVELFDSLA